MPENWKNTGLQNEDKIAGEYRCATGQLTVDILHQSAMRTG